MNAIRNRRRRENYEKLRSAGYSALFCTRFKDSNREDVQILADLKKQNDLVLINQIYALTEVRVNAKDIA